jgi:hypothetical protein
MNQFPPYPSQPNPYADIREPVYGMPAEVNPYAPPKLAGDYRPVSQKPASWDGLWRQGKLLVMHQRAPLPDVCVKSNQPCHRRLKRSLAWHPWPIYLLIFLHLLIYLVVALIVQKKATIHIGLSDEWFARRRIRIVIAWSVVFLSLVLFIGSIAMVDQYPAAGFGILAGVLLFFVAAIWGLFAARLVSAKRITDEFVWLKGVHPDFLARLPEWPYAV